MSQITKLSRTSQQKHLSLTQVKRMKSQTDLEKKSKQDSLSVSPKPDDWPSQPSKSSKDLKSFMDSTCLSKLDQSNLKTPTKESAYLSQPSTPLLIQRKHNRSLTAVNSPNDSLGSSFSVAAQNSTRRVNITRTQVAETCAKVSAVSGKPSPVNPTQNLSNNIKTDSTSVRLAQKEKSPLGPKAQNFADQVKITSEETEKFGQEAPQGRKANRMAKRSSGNGSLSGTSFYLNDLQQDLLSELARSVKELNVRLVHSEETTYARLRENLELQNKIKALEGRIDAQKHFRLDEKAVRSGCASACVVI